MPPRRAARARTLTSLRRRIDAADRRLLLALALRAKLVDQLWDWKRTQRLPRVDRARERALRRALLDQGQALGLARAALSRVFDRIIGVRLRAPRR